MPSAVRSRQKHYGAFYTPEQMAAALIDWAVREPTDTVLDPSFGGLVFLREAERRLRELGCQQPGVQLFGSDLDEEALIRAADLATDGATLVHRDFLRVAPAGAMLPRATVVAGNPPYVRYQSWKQARERGRRIAARHDVQLTRLASSWAPLLLHAADFVAPAGRLVQVLPAEIVHAQYSEGVLDAICARFGRVSVAMFEQHVFPGAQEEVVLLLADDRGESTDGVEVISATDLDDLAIPDSPGVTMHVDSQHKLLAGLLDPAAVQAYDELRSGTLTRLLGDLASVDIGAVTGANEWFVRSAKAVDHLSPELVRPVVSKAAHVAGAWLTEPDIAAMDERGVPARMLVLRADGPLREHLAALVAEGEDAGIHERYKCRSATPGTHCRSARCRTRRTCS